jgi:hypothetical protein
VPTLIVDCLKIIGGGRRRISSAILDALELLRTIAGIRTSSSNVTASGYFTPVCTLTRV